jgi:hypothetical protein
MRRLVPVIGLQRTIFIAEPQNLSALLPDSAPAVQNVPKTTHSAGSKLSEMPNKTLSWCKGFQFPCVFLALALKSESIGWIEALYSARASMQA